jgi:hypothetical protein
MAERDRPHLFVDGVTAENYRRPPRRMDGKALPAPTDRTAHAQGLITSLEAAGARAVAQRDISSIRVEGSIPGIYVVFESFPGIDLAFERLDPRQGKLHPQLRSVRQVFVDGEVVEQATVFIPDGKLGYFLKRIEQYEETATLESPRHRDLVDRIESIGVASLEQLWTDSTSEFPTSDDIVWWEVWLRRRDGQESQRFRAFAEQRQLEVGPRILAFTDRTVVLVRASRAELANALDVLDDLAELRLPRTSVEFIAMEPAAEQAEWVDDLAERLMEPPHDSPAACILDTGVDHGHALLAPALKPTDCYTCDPAWGIDDHKGHGTEMAGLALFGDLSEVVISRDQIRLRHRLESVKILPRVGVNPPELFGAITATAASLVEIQAPDRPRVFAVATTTDGVIADGTRPMNVGQPSSWSAAVDALAAGLEIETTSEGIVFLDADAESRSRLFVVSAGNVKDIGDDYLTRCDLEPIEDPAQAWNALTVGAHTELSVFDPDEVGYDDWTQLAPHGELSPCSRTSVACSPAWPIKPDVVLEGGNVVLAGGV